MQGHSHALSGAVTGLAAGIVLHKSLPADVALSGFTAGMALLPDLDSCHASSARCLGFLSYAVAWVVRLVSGGHRHATHSLLGIGVFTGLAWLAGHYRADVAGKAGLALLITIAVSGAIEALHLTDSHLSDVIAVAVAAAVVWHGYGLALIPLATALGCGTHIAGDMLTDSGCPLAWPLSLYRVHIPEPFAFTTGSRRETWGVVPVLSAALAFLAAWAADPRLVEAAWNLGLHAASRP
jgi:membrane-bound metal-dependent hydrolase YbcI (DUF457 family)